MSAPTEDNKKSVNKNNNNAITISRSTFTRLIVVVVAALIVASFAGGYNLGRSGQTGTANPPTAQQALPAGTQPLQLPQAGQQPLSAAPAAPVKISSISLDGAPFEGKPNAPVTMVEFSDFQCPFCGSFFTQIEPQILKTYVDSGKLKLVYKQFPLVNVHPNARDAALASECANEQGKFWPYHNALFGNQTTWANQNSTQVISTFKKYGSDLGLNSVSFNSCLDSKKYSSAVDKDSQQATTYGASGTPTFYIGNEKNGYTQVVGAQPFSTFQQTIDQVVNP